MIKEELKEARNKVVEIEKRNSKIMWEHMHWIQKIIYLLGWLVLIYLSYRFSQWIFS